MGCPDGCVAGRCVHNACYCDSGFEGDRCEHAFHEELEPSFTIYQVVCCIAFVCLTLYCVRVMNAVLATQRGKIFPISTRFMAVFTILAMSVVRSLLFAVDAHNQRRYFSSLMQFMVSRALFYPFLFSVVILVPITWAEILQRTGGDAATFLTRYKWLFIGMNLMLFMVEICTGILLYEYGIEVMAIVWQIYVTLLAAVDTILTLFFGTKLYIILNRFKDVHVMRVAMLAKLRALIWAAILLLPVLVALSTWMLAFDALTKPRTWLAWHACTRSLETVAEVALLNIFYPLEPARTYAGEEEGARSDGL
eukprot:TRINITY_DN1313_c0_g1_i4.p1 TRINITY_DN1313_c0_g1~~TRINITY_DN1313_c0_g1_i4.p1  ORF type:complete len:308 (+),score=28.33 TRINITY_DN1313_c0_g1_i4:118-1041(+)